jgi:hypothetical protein
MTRQRSMRSSVALLLSTSALTPSCCSLIRCSCPRCCASAASTSWPAASADRAVRCASWSLTPVPCSTAPPASSASLLPTPAAGCVAPLAVTATGGGCARRSWRCRASLSCVSRVPARPGACLRSACTNSSASAAQATRRRPRPLGLSHSSWREGEHRTKAGALTLQVLFRLRALSAWSCCACSFCDAQAAWGQRGVRGVSKRPKTQGSCQEGGCTHQASACASASRAWASMAVTTRGGLQDKGWNGGGTQCVCVRHHVIICFVGWRQSRRWGTAAPPAGTAACTPRRSRRTRRWACLRRRTRRS